MASEIRGAGKKKTKKILVEWEPEMKIFPLFAFTALNYFAILSLYHVGDELLHTHIEDASPDKVQWFYVFQKTERITT